MSSSSTTKKSLSQDSVVASLTKEISQDPLETRQDIVQSSQLPSSPVPKIRHTTLKNKSVTNTTLKKSKKSPKKLKSITPKPVLRDFRSKRQKRSNKRSARSGSSIQNKKRGDPFIKPLDDSNDWNPWDSVS